MDRSRNIFYNLACHVVFFLFAGGNVVVERRYSFSV